ncbi:hypothetical protein LINPERPRIM_LOCUS9420, partial [Linum perenne]
VTSQIPNPEKEKIRTRLYPTLLIDLSLPWLVDSANPIQSRAKYPHHQSINHQSPPSCFFPFVPALDLPQEQQQNGKQLVKEQEHEQEQEQHEGVEHFRHFGHPGGLQHHCREQHFQHPKPGKHFQHPEPGKH